MEASFVTSKKRAFVNKLLQRFKLEINTPPLKAEQANAPPPTISSPPHVVVSPPRALTPVKAEELPKNNGHMIVDFDELLNMSDDEDFESTSPAKLESPCKIASLEVASEVACIETLEHAHIEPAGLCESQATNFGDETRVQQCDSQMVLQEDEVNLEDGEIENPLEEYVEVLKSRVSNPSKRKRYLHSLEISTVESLHTEGYLEQWEFIDIVKNKRMADAYRENINNELFHESKLFKSMFDARNLQGAVEFLFSFPEFDEKASFLTECVVNA